MIEGHELLTEAPAQALARAQREQILTLVHELRKPLQGIEAFAGLLQGELAHDGRLGEYARIVLSSARDLSATFDRLTDFARLEPLARQEVDIEEEFESVARIVIGPGGRVEAAAHVAEATRVIRADRRSIRQVFYNVISNAIEAMPDGGRLDFDARRRGRLIVLSFRDTGGGMDRETLARAGVPFRSGKGRGLGLGLAIVKRIARAHGGGVEISSKPGGPTTVRVSIEEDANDRR